MAQLKKAQESIDKQLKQQKQAEDVDKKEDDKDKVQLRPDTPKYTLDDLAMRDDERDKEDKKNKTVNPK